MSTSTNHPHNRTENALIWAYAVMSHEQVTGTPHPDLDDALKYAHEALLSGGGNGELFIRSPMGKREAKEQK